MSCSFNNQVIPTDKTEFNLIGRLQLDEIYPRSIVKEFNNKSSNELGQYCAISMFIENEFLYLPNPITKEILTIDFQSFLVKKSLPLEYTPAFITKLNDQNWIYSSFDLDGIIVLQELNKQIKNSNTYFKECHGTIMYLNKGAFKGFPSLSWNYRYSNPYIDWDFYLLENDSLAILYIDHEGNSDCVLELVSNKGNSKIYTIDKTSRYDTFKCLGTINNDLVLCLSNSDSLEIHLFNLTENQVIRKIILPNPFSSIELVMGDYSAFWPNQTLVYLFGKNIYVLGTSRKEIILYEASIEPK